jgi:uncharacterized protein YndB with AHSA1/START domain
MTDDFGELDRSGARLVLRFTRVLAHPPTKVWRALTEPEHLAAWFPTTIDGERAVGAALRFAFPNHEAPDMHGEMLAFEPPTVLELRWGDEILRFELDGDDAKTVLTFSDTFDELGKAARDAAGWHSCLDLLGFDIAEEPSPWSSADRWRQVHGEYVARLGADASTIGPPAEWEEIHGVNG